MTRTARVTNISPKTTKEQLVSHVVAALGSARYASLAHGNGSQPQTATITFENPSTLKKAVRRTDRIQVDGSGIEFDTNFLGMTTLADPSSPAVDVVALHGLGGHAFSTWASRESEFMWLRDALPNNMPSARVLTWGYNANIVSGVGISDIPRLAGTFLVSLQSFRRDAGRPLILLAHSLGGIIVKKAMVKIDSEYRFEDLRNKVKGVVFLGTPHRGGNGVTLGLTIASFLTTINIHSRRDLLAALDPTAPILHDIDVDFKHLFKEKLKVHSFAEDLPMKFGIWPVSYKIVIVDSDSATLGDDFADESRSTLNADHINICKFQNQGDPLYQPVRDALTDITATLPLAEDFSGDHPAVQSSSSGIYDTSRVIPNPSVAGQTPIPVSPQARRARPPPRATFSSSRSPPVTPNPSVADQSPIPDTSQTRRARPPPRGTSTTSHIVGADKLTLDEANFVMVTDGQPPGDYASVREVSEINIGRGDFYMGSSNGAPRGRRYGTSTLPKRY